MRLFDEPTTHFVLIPLSGTTVPFDFYQGQVLCVNANLRFYIEIERITHDKSKVTCQDCLEIIHS